MEDHIRLLVGSYNEQLNQVSKGYNKNTNKLT